MSKAARRAHRDAARHAANHQTALLAAAAARDAFGRVWADTDDDLTAIMRALDPASNHHRLRVHTRHVHALVDDYKRNGYDWAPATYVPGALIAAGLIRETLEAAGIDDVQRAIDGSEHLPAHLGVRTALLAGWDRAPLVAVFDDTLADALTATPMTGDIPHQLLQRLPAWTVYLATPWLRPGSGVFVGFDAGAVTRHQQPDTPADIVDDFTLLFITGDPPNALLAYIRCSEPTITASIDAQARDAGPGTTTGAQLEALTDDLYGRPYRQLLEQVMSLVLYLCSDEPDVHTVQPPPDSSGRRPAPPGAAQLIEVGYRVGVALRTANTTPASSDPGAGGLVRPTPHVRVAHWHTYWYGPRTNPAERTARLRWIAPTLINADLADPAATARRVRPPAS